MTNHSPKSPNRDEWDALPDIYVRLRKDELGYPPKDWEQLKAERVGQENRFKIKSIPFYARGLAFEDEVLTEKSPEGYHPVFRSVRWRSGYSTIRLMIQQGEDQQKLIDFFVRLDTLLEFSGRLVALAIPRHKFDEVSQYIYEEKQNGRWDAEDGFLIIDDPLMPAT
jgi:hypothetical protein